ncbi:MAG: hypothetical protein ACTSR2_01195 [Candidatus Hodarchaeales archaeon]
MPIGKRGRPKIFMKNVTITDLRTGKVFKEADILDITKVKRNDGSEDILILFRYKYYGKWSDKPNWNYILTSMKNKKIEPNGI